mmetsp:Transcript_22208/g.46523  ORF Transcript_22208/g.46523 Transcript_22208/m.46523 type:complete len:422 (-) Transcript_22208:426-1691(-)
MRPHHYVHFPRSDRRSQFPPLFGILPHPAAQQRHVEIMLRPLPHPPNDLLEMLRRQHPRRSQERRLPPVGHASEQGPHRHLRLPESDVPANQSIHGTRPPHHIVLHVLEALLLIRRRFVGEGFGEFPDSSFRAGIEGRSIQRFPRGVQGQDVLGHLDGVGFDSVFGLGPGLALDAGQAGFDGGVSGAVAGEAVGPFYGYVDHGVGVGDFEEGGEGVGYGVLVFVGPKVGDCLLDFLERFSFVHESVDDLFPSFFGGGGFLGREFGFGFEDRFFVATDAVFAVDDEISWEDLEGPSSRGSDGDTHELLAGCEFSVDDAGESVFVWVFGVDVVVVVFVALVVDIVVVLVVIVSLRQRLQLGFQIKILLRFKPRLFSIANDGVEVGFGLCFVVIFGEPSSGFRVVAFATSIDHATGSTRIVLCR